MLSKYAKKLEEVTNNSPEKDYVMADGEEAYRDAAREVFHSANLMCWFHVVQDCTFHFK